jgi:hypothetical protein
MHLSPRTKCLFNLFGCEFHQPVLGRSSCSGQVVRYTGAPDGHFPNDRNTCGSPYYTHTFPKVSSSSKVSLIVLLCQWEVYTKLAIYFAVEFP